MVTSAQLEEALQRHLEGTSCFLVDAELRPGGKAVVEVDHEERPITLDDLTAINKALREEFGEALDDVELQVGSPGVGRPFKVERQYRKHQGKPVEVLRREGAPVEGVLEGHDQAGITVRILVPSKVKGRKPKLSEETTVIAFTDIKAVQATITIN
ncbi:MAG TPA: hypothetical protein PKD45_03015 [Flavobacteriales bacterium]|nr:hypothetical protein [Flavobacteriales bacterium]